MKKNNGTTETPASVICDGEQQVGACPVASPLRQVTNPGEGGVEVPLGAIENGRVFADRLEAYPFTSEGGDLRNCTDWNEFRRCFDHLAEWALSLTAAPQPAQAGASGGGGHEKMAAYLTQAIKDSEAGKTVFVRLTPGEVEECVTLLRTPASPATGDAATWEEEIRRHDATPPAHGDGEVSEESLRAWRKMADEVHDRFFWMLSPDKHGNHMVSHESVRAVVELCEEIEAGTPAYENLTTRPTPEAQEARDGEGPWCPSCGSMNITVSQVVPEHTRQWTTAEGDFVEHMPQSYDCECGNCSHQWTDYPIDVEVDAALALPAQGENNDG